MASDQDNNKDMKTDEEEIVVVENDDSSDKKPTFRYRRLYDHVGQKSSVKQKTLAFIRMWSWPLVWLLLLLMVINYFIVKILYLYKDIKFLY